MADTVSQHPPPIGIPTLTCGLGYRTRRRKIPHVRLVPLNVGQTDAPLRVDITVVEQAPVSEAHARGPGMAALLEKLAARGTCAGITDPARWQRELRQESATGTYSLTGTSPVMHRFSSRRQQLAQSFLTQRLHGAQAYDRIAGYFSSSMLEVAGEAVRP